MRSLRNFSKVAMSSTLSSTGWKQSMVYFTVGFLPPALPPFLPAFCSIYGWICLDVRMWVRVCVDWQRANRPRKGRRLAACRFNRSMAPAALAFPALLHPRPDSPQQGSPSPSPSQPSAPLPPAAAAAPQSPAATTDTSCLWPQRHQRRRRTQRGLIMHTPRRRASTVPQPLPSSLTPDPEPRELTAGAMVLTGVL